MKAVLLVTVIFSVIVAGDQRNCSSTDGSGETGVCSLQCFVCNSERDPACSDPFHPDSSALRAAYLFTCNESPDGLQPFCRKSKTTFEAVEEVRVHRDCGYLERAGYECYQNRAEDYVHDVCQCKDELCNGATTVGAAILALIIPLTVAALL